MQPGMTPEKKVRAAHGKKQRQKDQTPDEHAQPETTRPAEGLLFEIPGSPLKNAPRKSISPKSTKSRAKSVAAPSDSQSQEVAEPVPVVPVVASRRTTQAAKGQPPAEVVVDAVPAKGGIAPVPAKVEPRQRTRKNAASSAAQNQPAPAAHPTATGAFHADDPRYAMVWSELSHRVGPRSFALWFEDKSRVEILGEQLLFSIGSPFLLNCISKQFRKDLGEVARAVLGPSGTVSLQVDGSLALLPANDTAAPAAASAPLPTGRHPTASEKAVPKSLASNPATTGRGRSQKGMAAAPVAAPPDSSPAPVRSRSAEADLRTPDVSKNSTSHRSHEIIRGNGTPGPNLTQRQRRLADLHDFVTTPITEFAVTACRQVATAKASQFNPLFLYGTVGTGKTHLLEGICRQFRKSHPQFQVALLTAEAFANYFTQALNDRTLPSFRQKFRGVDVLLIDDVDFFESKRVFQEEFLHTLGDLVDHGRQVVVTADRHPRLLTKLGDDLVSRFQSGLICRLEMPEIDGRRQIVQRKAQKLDGDFAPEALQFVAERFSGNVRELEGALNCLHTFHGMTNKRVTLSAAKQVLAELERDCLRVVRLADIERVICQVFGIKAKELKSDSRVRTLAQPRMLAMFLARRHTQSAYSEIGQHFGGRNHSTVMSAERKVQKWLTDNESVRVASQDWTFQEIVTNLEQLLLAG